MRQLGNICPCGENVISEKHRNLYFRIIDQPHAELSVCFPATAPVRQIFSSFSSQLLSSYILIWPRNIAISITDYL